MNRLGFIGLGNMGGHMARNLVAAGRELQVFDVVPALLGSVDGASPAATVGEAVRGVEAVVTMLPAGRHVREAYLGEGGVLENSPRDPGV